MSELRVRVHLRNGSTHEVVREVADRPTSGGGTEKNKDSEWRANEAARLIEEIGNGGTWASERWFIPPHAIDAVEFMSGPVPAERKREREADYYDPDTWANSRG